MFVTIANQGAFVLSGAVAAFLFRERCLADRLESLHLG